MSGKASWRHCFRKCGSTIRLPSLREGGTAAGGEYAFAYCTPVLTLHKCEILHIHGNATFHVK